MIITPQRYKKTGRVKIVPLWHLFYNKEGIISFSTVAKYFQKNVKNYYLLLHIHFFFLDIRDNFLQELQFTNKRTVKNCKECASDNNKRKHYDFL